MEDFQRWVFELLFTGSEKSSPQGYTITFEILSQKIISKNSESLIKYLENKSSVNKKSVSQIMSIKSRNSGYGKFKISVIPVKQPALTVNCQTESFRLNIY